MTEGNNFNSELNSNNQANNNSTQPVTNKFFPSGLLGGNIKDVNSSTTNGANSQFISRKTWGVGDKAKSKTENVSEPEQTEVLDLFDGEVETLMDEVNGTTYNAGSNNQTVNQTVVNNQNNYNQPVNQPINQSMPTSVVNQGVDSNNQAWMEKQPLSMGGLGVNTLVGDDAPKEVVENNKYIPPRNFELKGNNKIEIVKDKPVNDRPSIYNGFKEPLPEIDEVKVCKEYAGEAFTKITMAPFSFPGFLLGGIYCIYRKLYIVGLIALLIEFAILTILSMPISFIGVFIFRIVVALVVNQIYLKTVKIKVRFLRKHNPKKNQYELSVLAKKKGGTSSLMALIAAILYIAFIIIIGFTFNFKSLLSLLPKDDEPVINEDSKGVTGYNGDLSYEEYNIEDNFSISIPKGFVKDGNYFNYIYRVPLPVTEEENNNSDETEQDQDNVVDEQTEEEKKPKVEYSKNKCTLSFNAVKGYKNEEDLIKSIAYYYTQSEDEGVSEQPNNGIEWHTFESSKSDEKIYFKVTKRGDKLLLFMYKMEAEDENKVCEGFYNDIYNSIYPK